jgi:hypothetical protein
MQIMDIQIQQLLSTTTPQNFHPKPERLNA